MRKFRLRLIKISFLIPEFAVECVCVFEHDVMRVSGIGNVSGVGENLREDFIVVGPALAPPVADADWEHVTIFQNTKLGVPCTPSQL